jgi:dihydrofolate synthase / folylpolyglutamate synthase
VGFHDAQSYLDSLGVDLMRSRAPSLHRVEAMCEALDHPERSIPSIHVTGTNGKTTTARIATSLLAATGLSVGTFTSAHLTTVRERIARSGEPISEDEFGALFDHFFFYLQVTEKELDEKLSYFEVLSTMFYLWAAEAPVDALVVEVGMGGRWDATNVIDAPVSIVTNVELDHTRFLGNRVEEIAAEKAGIIKAGAQTVTGERAPGVLRVLSDEAASVGASLAVLDRDFALEDNRVALGGRYLSTRTRAGHHEGLFLPLHGGHQGVNAVVALEAAGRFLGDRALERSVVAEGLEAVTAPGRMETLSPDGGEGPMVVLDVAHNPAGISALVTSLAEAFAFERVHFVVGILEDKDYEGMLAELTRVSCAVAFCGPRGVRSIATGDLMVAAGRLGLECSEHAGVAEATTTALRAAGPGEIVCVTGSHYVVGEARGTLSAA